MKRQEKKIREMKREIKKRFSASQVLGIKIKDDSITIEFKVCAEIHLLILNPSDGYFYFGEPKKIIL